jgi:hypothetical protein
MVESPVKKLKINKKANRYDQKSGYTPAIQLKKINMGCIKTAQKTQGATFQPLSFERKIGLCDTKKKQQ